MGTLFDQPPRDMLDTTKVKMKLFLEMIKDLSEETQLPIESILEAYKIREMERQNDLYVHNGNIFDEQMSGFGAILEKLTDVVKTFKNQ